MATGVWGFPQQAKSPARQGGRERGFAGSVATLPMLAVFLFPPLLPIQEALKLPANNQLY